MAYHPKDDPKFPPPTHEAPKVYDVLAESDVWLSVWAGEGQLASVKIDGQTPTNDGGVWTLNVSAASVVKNTTIVVTDTTILVKDTTIVLNDIAIDAVVAHSNPNSSKGSLTIAAYQFHAQDVPINRKKWVVTWVFDALIKPVSETVHAR